MTTVTITPQETKQLAKDLVSSFQGGEAITLQGELGSGKTTFTQGLAEALGIVQRVNSPTFLISKSYATASDKVKKLYHIDLYRLQNVKEVEELGIKELLSDKQAVTVIEWPERLGKLLPKKRIAVEFEYVDEDKRKVTINNYE